MRVYSDLDLQLPVRWGEISSPGIVTAGGLVFEILDEGIELLVGPSKSKA